jgi:branched-chain amino acid transport system substrate-binding protein
MGIFSGPYSVTGGDDGFKLAVDQINATGGILGRRVEFKEFNTDITAEGASSATALALGYHPDVVIGYGVSAGLVAAAKALDRSGVLVIDNTLDATTSAKALGSQLYFRMSLTDPQFAIGADQYLFRNLGVTRMMVINTNDAAPSQGAAVILGDATAQGVQTMHESVSPEVTDLTSEILAAKAFGAQAIWEWGYPTTDGLLIKQAAANGYNGYLMTFSAEVAASAGLIPTSLLTGRIFALSGEGAPQVSGSSASQAYRSAFTSKFDVTPSTAVSNCNYDALYLYRQAATDAGSADPLAVGAALRKADYQGVCGQERSDSNQDLLHTLDILSFPGAKETLAGTVTNIASPF